MARFALGSLVFLIACSGPKKNDNMVAPLPPEPQVETTSDGGTSTVPAPPDPSDPSQPDVPQGAIHDDRGVRVAQVPGDAGRGLPDAALRDAGAPIGRDAAVRDAGGVLAPGDAGGIGRDALVP